MKLIYISIILIISSISYASQNAVTDTGEVVILHDDGTWKLSAESKKSLIKLTTNKTHFKKPKNSIFLLKSKKNNSAFWVNTKKWSFTKKTKNTQAEYEFTLKGKDLYAMAITEAVEISPESLADIAFDNAKDAAPDIRIIKKEYRTVNNKKVIYLEMRGTLQSIKFTYIGYYYSNSSGSTQLVAYTGTNLISKYTKEIHGLLNGLTIY